MVGARQSRLGRGRRGPWSMWLELGGAARDVVDVVEAQWSRLGRGRREVGGATRDMVDVVYGRCELGRLAQSARLARRGSLDGLDVYAES